MIEFCHILKGFKSDFWIKKVIVLQDVSFKIEENQIVGFLGINGAGKTTLIKILLKFIKAEKGEILYSKKLGQNFKEIFSNIGYLPEHPYFYPHSSGQELVYYMGALNDIPREELKKRMNKWAKRLKISHALNRKIRSYSKGMLQRLGFVCALVHDPKILILDEPLSGLDPIGRKEIKDILREVNDEGKTVFFSSHILADVEEICSNIIVLEKGGILYDGRVDHLIEKSVGQDVIINVSLKGDSHSEFFQEEGVSFLRKDGDSCLFSVSSKLKERFLAQVLEDGGEVNTLRKDRLSLEEIIYKVK